MDRPPQEVSAGWWKRFWPGPWCAFAGALALRLFAMGALGLPDEITPAEVDWEWAYEQGAVAKSLVRGEGYADAFRKGTGPTAWCGPVYPVVLASLLHLYGEFTRPLATTLAILHVLLSAGISVFLWRLGVALKGPRMGAAAAWAWALHPAAIYFSIRIVWDSVLVAFGLAWFLAALAERGSRTGPRELVRLGLGFGALSLVNPTPLAVVPALLFFLGRGRGRAGALRAWLCFGLPAALVLAPWSVRNLVVLGTPGLKANLGVELMVGNCDGADGGFNPWFHPSYDEQQLDLYRELGEAAYAARCAGQFRAWVRDNPGRFAELTLVRMRNFWLGHDPFEEVPLRSGATHRRDWQGWIKWWVYFLAGLLALVGLSVYRDERGGRMLLGGVVLLFPTVYFVTHVLERYRFPIEPVITYLAAAAVLAVWDRLRALGRGSP